MSQYCRRCKRLFETDEVAFLHTIDYHKEDWLKFMTGEREISK